MADILTFFGAELHLEPGLEKIGRCEELPFVKDGDIEPDTSAN
ncbi:MAG: hypothetical protein ACLR7D_02980 [Lachnospira eligens]